MTSPAARILCTALLTAAAVGQRARDGTVVAPGIGQALDAAIVRTDPDFWGAVHVARGAEVLLAKGYGLADFGKTPNTPRTLFDVGSVAEQFTAAAILALEADRRLKVDETIGRFFSDLPADKAGITIHHLLSHTSGLPAKIKPKRGEEKDRDRLAGRILATPLESAPGETFLRSRFNYVLLAIIVEEASRKRFEAYLQRALFRAAGMKDTGFLKEPKLDRKRASLRRYPGGDSKRTAIEHAWNWIARGNTGVVTTVNDLHLWLSALRGNKVLKEAARQKLLRPSTGTRAYGWEAGLHGGVVVLRSAGLTEGYRAHLSMLIEPVATIALTGAQGEDLAPLAKALTDVLLAPAGEAVEVPVTTPAAAEPKERDPAPVNPANPATGPEPRREDVALREYVGTYRLSDGAGRLQVVLVGGALWIEGWGVEAAPRVRYGLPFHPAQPDLFRDLAARADAGVAALAAGRDPEEAFGAAAPARAARDLWRSLVSALGPHRDTEVVGTAIDGPAGTWLRAGFRDGDVWLRAKWNARKELSGLTREKGPHPFRAPLTSKWPDLFAGASPSGGRPLLISFEDAGAVLVWEDATPGAGGLLECPREVR